MRWRGDRHREDFMSIILIAGFAWLGLAVVGWSWFAMAARADRERSQRPPRATPPSRSQPRA